MENQNLKNLINTIALDNGYLDDFDLLMDYGIVPSRRIPSHKKYEFLLLLLNHFKNRHSKSDV